MPRIRRISFRRGQRSSRFRSRKRRTNRSRPSSRNRSSRPQTNYLITKAAFVNIAAAEAMVAGNGVVWFSDETDTQVVVGLASQSAPIVAAAARAREMAVDSITVSFLPASEINGNSAMVISDIGRQVEQNTIELLGSLPFAKVRSSKQNLSIKLKVAPHLRRLNKPFWIPSGHIQGQNDAGAYLGALARPSLYFVHTGASTPPDPANPVPGRFIGHLKTTVTFAFRGTR